MIDNIMIIYFYMTLRKLWHLHYLYLIQLIGGCSGNSSFFVTKGAGVKEKMFYLHLLQDEQMVKPVKGKIRTNTLYYKGSVKAPS
jgi:hypothetical protein